jgi:cobalt-zinc-cadmium efflux system membrane fusion protein
MKRRLLAIVALSLAAGCGAPPPAPEKGAVEPPPADAGSQRELRVPPDLQRKWGVATGPVEHLTVSGALRLPGVLALDQQRSARISAVLEGKVVSVAADLGDAVKKDQVLVVLHSPAFTQAQSAFLLAYSRRGAARRELDRAKELVRDEAIQVKEYQRRQADFEAASTDYSLAESNLHALGWGHPQIEAMVQRASKASADPSDLVDPYLRVRSPIDGRVIARDLVVGEHVHPDKLLFEVSDLSTLWAMLDAREQDLPAIGAASRVAIESQVYPGRTFDGRVARVGDVVDEKLRTIKVRVEVPNPGLLLKPNMYIQGAVQTNGRSRQVLGVPEEAVQTIDGEPSVFVVTAGKGFAVRTVQPGDAIGASRAILRGLDGTETIVVSGAFNLKGEWLKSSLSGE